MLVGAVVRREVGFRRCVRSLCTLRGQPLVRGAAAGPLLHSRVALSFWGSVDPMQGSVTEPHHPLHRQRLKGTVLVLPCGRGSSTSSQVLLQLMLNGHAPAAILLRDPDPILCVGAIVAHEMFDKSMPIIVVGEDGFNKLAGHKSVTIDIDGSVRLFQGNITQSSEAAALCAQAQGSRGDAPLTASKEMPRSLEGTLSLDDTERAMLEGFKGRAVQLAMRIVQRAAEAQGAKHLLPVTQAHIDSCMWISHASLLFVQRLVALGGSVAVPTTLNSASVDMVRWREMSVPPTFGEAASALGKAYAELGARPTFTCAPYLLDSAPRRGEHIGWGESNAVVYANSVLGARTQKYADFLDVCIAITGRAPAAGAHLEEERRPTILLQLCEVDFHPQRLASVMDDTFWPLLGHVCGAVAGSRVPLILGLEDFKPSRDDLKAFCAAFGTTGGAPLCHIHGHTPESEDVIRGAFPVLAETRLAQVHADAFRKSRTALDHTSGDGPRDAYLSDKDRETIIIRMSDLGNAFDLLDGREAIPPHVNVDIPREGDDEAIQLVALGNPHLSLDELAKLASLTRGHRCHPEVRFVITVGRDVFAVAASAGYTSQIERFGALIVTDTCWCMIEEPIVPVNARTILTNSVKYAHYAPGLSGRRARLTSLSNCVRAAVNGRLKRDSRPPWLVSSGARQAYVNAV